QRYWMTSERRCAPCAVQPLVGPRRATNPSRRRGLHNRAYALSAPTCESLMRHTVLRDVRDINCWTDRHDIPRISIRHVQLAARHGRAADPAAAEALSVLVRLEDCDGRTAVVRIATPWDTHAGVWITWRPAGVSPPCEQADRSDND